MSCILRIFVLYFFSLLLLEASSSLKWVQKSNNEAQYVLKMKLFTVTWCSYCKQLEAQMKANPIFETQEIQLPKCTIRIQLEKLDVTQLEWPQEQAMGKMTKSYPEEVLYLQEKMLAFDQISDLGELGDWILKSIKNAPQLSKCF